LNVKTIVFDIDGVLADWSTGFSRWAREVYPDVPIVSHNECVSWDVRPGMTSEMERVIWDLIKQDTRFWEDLPPLATDREFIQICHLIDKGHNVYFATNRKTPGALRATRNWLNRYLNISFVNIIITHRKGEFCKVVDADYYIDDKSENVDCAIWMTDKKTKAYVLTRLYNSGVYAPHSKSARRVSTITHLLEDIDADL
jgi:5'(3')-deoxyribonucleotidase